MCKLLGFCASMLLSVWPLDNHKLQSMDRERGSWNWLAWMLRTHEKAYMRIGGLYGGKVLAIESGSITVQSRKWLWPRTFSLAPAIVSDRIPLLREPGMGHRIKDVCIGDWVQMDVTPSRETKDGYVCYSLGIYRRPGGKIPPAEDDYLPERSRMHNIYNTLQFMEERVYPALSQLLARAVYRCRHFAQLR